jgi:sugar phosphate isomerase/epimerase
VKRCLNNITLGPEVPFADSALAASKAGFEGMEIFSMEPVARYAEANSERDLVSMFDSLTIEPVGFVLGGFVYQRDAEFKGNAEDLEKIMSLAGMIGARNALVFIPSKGEMAPDEAVELATRRITDTVEMAGKHGLQIGLEPIGKADFLNDPSSVYQLVKDIDSRNLGLTIDVFHFYTAGCRTPDLRAIPSEKLFLVHVDDAPGLPVSELDDSKRVLPGQGALDLEGFLATLAEMGYDGPLSVELFNRDLWAEDPVHVATASRNALEKVMKGAGVS